MQENNQNNEIKNNILDRIKKEEIKMTPRQFFFMKSLTMFVTSVFFLILATYVFAYVIFLFIDNGIIYIPIFSESGLINFIVEIPWTLVFLGLLSIFLFSITSKTFYKIYRKPFLTFFFTILAIIIISQLIIVQTGTMKFLKEEAYKDHIQLVPNKFLEFRSSQTGSIFVGYVVATTSNSIIIRDRQNNSVELLNENTIDLNTFLIGQLINAYGERRGQQFFVKSIEIIN